MFNIRRVAAILLGIAIATASFAASVVGTWHGHFDISKFKAPPGQDPKQVTMIRQMMANIKITITFKADKTYTTTFVGGPKNQTASHGGTWTQAGNTITTKPSKAPKQGPQTQTLTISANGKTLTATPHGGPNVTVIFTR